MSHALGPNVEQLAQARGTVTNLVPVAEAALTCHSRESVVRTIARQIERNHNGIVRAHIAAEAIVRLAEEDDVDEPLPPAAGDIRLAHDYPGFGGEDADRARRHADADLRGGR